MLRGLDDYVLRSVEDGLCARDVMLSRHFAAAESGVPGYTRAKLWTHHAGRLSQMMARLRRELSATAVSVATRMNNGGGGGGGMGLGIQQDSHNNRKGKRKGELHQQQLNENGGGKGVSVSEVMKLAKHMKERVLPTTIALVDLLDSAVQHATHGLHHHHHREDIDTTPTSTSTSTSPPSSIGYHHHHHHHHNDHCNNNSSMKPIPTTHHDHHTGDDDGADVRARLVAALQHTADDVLDALNCAGGKRLAWVGVHVLTRWIADKRVRSEYVKSLAKAGRLSPVSRFHRRGGGGGMDSSVAAVLMDGSNADIMHVSVVKRHRTMLQDLY